MPGYRRRCRIRGELAGRARAQGEVVATELDIAFLPDDIANLHPLKHDVLTDEFAPASFDLIHSRAVFQVFPDAAAVLRRVIPWLRPGGWFVLEEIDGAAGLGSPLPSCGGPTR